MNTNSTSLLQLRFDKQADKNFVYASGKINMETWTEFSTQVRALVPEAKPIRVDLSQVVQIDSTGIGTLVSVWASAKKVNCDLKYVNPHKRVEDVIRLTKLFDMFETPENSVAAD